MKSPFVSVIIPVKEINDYICEAVPKHLKLDYPNLEILILPDRASQDKFGSRVRIIPTYPETGPAGKRDIGVKEACGEILAFIDDDAYPRRDWLRNAVKHFGDVRVAAVCGPGVTPPSDSIWLKASGWVQASRLGGGGYTYRFIPQKKRLVDDYPSMNFIVRKSDFEEVGGFDSHFWPGEDTKLCLDVTYTLKKKIIYDPEVLVYHHRRALFVPHLKQIGRYGLHRGYFARTLPQTSRRFSYLIPSLFALGLILGPLVILAARFLSLFYFLSLALYIVLLILTSFWVLYQSRDIRLALLVIPGIFLTHMWYGLRFIQGFFSKGLKR